jgi:putative addiction module killer protein
VPDGGAGEVGLLAPARPRLTMVTDMVPSNPVEVLEYLDAAGRSPFARWFNGLNAAAAAKVTTALTRIAQDHFSQAKGVGSGAYEYKIDFGPCYRLYFGKDGKQLVILLGGGTKKGQQQDIAIAIARWRDYKQRKARG